MSQQNRLPLIISVIALIASIAGFSYLLLSPPSKLVYVDTARLLDQYQGMIDARADFQKKATAWQAM